MVEQTEFYLPEFKQGFHLVTSLILSNIGKLPEKGILHLFIKHTSAGLTINENADPAVRDDFRTFFDRRIPEDFPGFKHTLEGKDDMPAHIKASLIGQSVTIPFTNGQLNMGIWQGIYLCEFRHSGGRRKIAATVIS
ncbi:MAG: secondary thiamine-phosphate synthase enzyme YjbQ [Candidatus Azobacteroides sp.]|jgi:secondary thiamine-phosphate synthase enzyme|nr:secondary thiamine-phosphate synthase enzyme YjbQ [Candidatus Azobacteroides sp.]